MAFWVTTHEGLIKEETERKELPEKFALNIFEDAVTFRLYGEGERVVDEKAKWVCQTRLHRGRVSPLSRPKPPILPSPALLPEW